MTGYQRIGRHMNTSADWVFVLRSILLRSMYCITDDMWGDVCMGFPRGSNTTYSQTPSTFPCAQKTFQPYSEKP